MPFDCLEKSKTCSAATTATVKKKINVQGANKRKRLKEVSRCMLAIECTKSEAVSI